MATDSLGRPVSSKDDADAVLKGGRSMRGVKNPDNRPYSIFEPAETVGSKPEPDYDSSPDVQLDGSVPSDDEETTAPHRQIESKQTSHISGYLVAVVCMALAVVLLLLAIYF